MRILLVEDHGMVRKTICAQLQALGHEVSQAEDGSEALAKLERADSYYDLLLTDIRMPGKLDGWSVAEHARRVHPKLPVLYATAFSNTPYRPVPRSIVLKKPFTTQMLSESLSRLCDQAGGLSH